MRMLQKFAALFSLLLLTVSASAADYQEGKHFDRLLIPVPSHAPAGKIEVVELFWYGCPHCYSFEPAVRNWLKSKPEDVVFERLPAILGKHWKLHAQAYYTAKVLGQLDAIHSPLFEAIHVKKKSLDDRESLARFFSEQGVPEEKFNQAFDSFGVQTMIQQSDMRVRGYRVRGVPTLIVNGKYRIKAQPETFAIVDYLVERERKAMATAAAGQAK